MTTLWPVTVPLSLHTGGVPLQREFGLNCDDEHLIAYFDNSAQLAMRAKATYMEHSIAHVTFPANSSHANNSMFVSF